MNLLKNCDIRQLDEGGRRFMGLLALRLSSEALPQSNRNIMLHFNALSYFVFHLREHLPAYICQKCQHFFFFYGKCSRGILIKDSVWSLFGLNLTAESHFNIFGLALPFFSGLWLNTFLLVWLRATLRQSGLGAAKISQNNKHLFHESG